MENSQKVSSKNPITDSIVSSMHRAKESGDQVVQGESSAVIQDETSNKENHL